MIYWLLDRLFNTIKHPYYEHTLSREEKEFILSHYPTAFSASERALEKQRSRGADVRALESGAKSRDDLRRENGAFAFPRVRVNYDSAVSQVNGK